MSCAVVFSEIACAASSPGTPPMAIDAAAGSDAAGPPSDASEIPDDAAPLPPQTTRLRIVNRCDETIWIAHSNNVPSVQNVALAPAQHHDYEIPDGGLPSARFWPKVGCGADGHGCLIGDTGEGGGAPCGPTGCQPPLDSKFEVTFAALGSVEATFYNLSLVDGYTLPFAVTPIGAGAGVGGCTASDCSELDLDACPANEDIIDADLRVTDPGDPSTTIGCLSPCKAWHYPAPYGLGNPESEDPGLHMCCPTPIDPGSGQCTPANGCMTPDACRAEGDPLSVVHTTYVALVHAGCPTAYGYSYDDAAGLHACPADTAFEVVFCP
jgi:hypothetical protein